jgi:ribonuclease G
MQTLEKCPACGGSGEVQASIVLIDEIENNIRYLIREQNAQYLKLAVHPFIYAYLRKGLWALQRKWYRTYRKWIKLEPVNSYHYMEYHFFNKLDDEISLI